MARKPTAAKTSKDFAPVLLPLNDAQRRAEELIKKADWMFLVGCAGTGKTHQAVKMAIQAMKDPRVLGFQPRRILLSRPMVEAGSPMGYLPGDIDAKIAPWLEAIQDVLGRISAENPEQLIKTMFKYVSLGHMRGRTFDDAIVIIDEAQNCTWDQLELAYTRLGKRAKMIFTGDHTQSDLPIHKQCFGHFTDSLLGLQSAAVVYFDSKMILRNPRLEEGLTKIRAGKERWLEEKYPDPLTTRSPRR